MKRSQLKRGTVAMKRSGRRPARLTVKRQERRERRAEWAVAVKARDWMCMYAEVGTIGLWWGCTKKTTDAHHILARSQGGTDALSNGFGLCHEHHMWVHDNRIEAQALGLLAHVGDFSWLPGMEPVGVSDKERA